jgi:hypothetical protein
MQIFIYFSNLKKNPNLQYHQIREPKEKEKEKTFSYYTISMKHMLTYISKIKITWIPNIDYFLKKIVACIYDK